MSVPTEVPPRRTKSWLFPIVYFSIVITILCSLVWVSESFRHAAPSDTTFSYASGHYGDFYGYSYMLRRGQEGHLLYKNIYTSEITPDILTHPFFHILGFLTKPTGSSTGYIFFLARLISWSMLFITVYVCIDRLLKNRQTKIVAGIFFLSATSIWNFRIFLESHQIVMPVIWNDYFDAYGTFVRLPPHHIAAFICMICVLLLLAKPSGWKFREVSGYVLSICIGLLQPYLSFFLTVILVCYVCLNWLDTKKRPPDFRFIARMCGIHIALMGLNFYQLQYVQHLPFAVAGVMLSQFRNVSIATYIGSLGPLFWLSLTAFGNPLYRNTPGMKLLILWAWIPIVFFLLPEIGNLTSTNRLLQTYQHIPFALLSAIGIDGIFGRMKSYRYIVLFLAILSAAYGFIPYITKLNTELAYIHTENFNVFIPDDLSAAFRFIENSTSPDSMILAGTAVSSMVPAFTDARVFVGADSSTPDFYGKQAQMIAVFQGTPGEADLHAYLRGNHINYIVFGIDSPGWEDSPYNGVSFLREVFASGPVRIIRVI